MRSSYGAAYFNICFGDWFFNCGAGGEGILADEDGFDDVALVFGANLLKRSLSVMGGNTFGDSSGDTLAAVVILVRDLRGA